ncbi:Chemotaxis protein CheY [Rosistilla carotiformis]|uniref:Chemotaxis protein CheY n=1 Tax=Rosistilla carotiformis TaxID=2528017 RepID=A0A518JZR1_9BACT|nr:response regulator [Rosistilla carotiformis]QDV71037.1 Chemotaxis protein CheY [Rosistilla carotiformis]
MDQKVLLADDSGVMRKIILRALNAAGVTDVVEAADGAQAWTAFQTTQFDMVLTDWNMPMMTGLDLLKNIRQAGSTIPVIMITTESERGRVIEAIQAGVSDFLPKPFENELLQEKLVKHLSALAS